MADVQAFQDQSQIGASQAQPESLIDGVLAFYGHANSQPRRKRCVIFVHGLTGNIQSTWQKKLKPGEPKVPSFPELIMSDGDLDDYDVLSFGYRSRYVRGAPIRYAAAQLRFAIDHLASREVQRDRSHRAQHGRVGMHALYSRPAWRRRASSYSRPLALRYTDDRFRHVKAAKLVGYGIGLRIPVIRRLLNLFLRGQRQIVDLASGSEFLAILHEQWSLRVVNGGHEKAGSGRMWLPVRVITGEDDFLVTEASGKGVYGAIDWLPIPCSHVELVKPSGTTDPRYIRAKEFLAMSRQVKSRDVLDPIWQASQNIWASRLARLIANVDFQTFIGVPDPFMKAQLKASGYTACVTECAYDAILEEGDVLFGISLDELWRYLAAKTAAGVRASGRVIAGAGGRAATAAEGYRV